GAGVAGLDHPPAGAGEVEDEPLARLQRLDRAALDGAPQPGLHAGVVGDDVAGVDRDRLARAEHDLALTGRLQDESALAAEQVLRAAPAGLDVHAVRVGDPAAAGDVEGPVRGDGHGDDVAGQVGGD